MNPITHLFAGWTLGDLTTQDQRDRALIAWSGVAPDLDGLSFLPDVINRLLNRPPTDYYFQYHHLLAHGLPAAVLCGVAVFASARHRMRTALLAFASFHLHLLCDLVGSRGPDKAEIWPIAYLQPLSGRLAFAWSGQWALNAWPNIALTLLLMAFIFVRAVRTGHSPVSLFSTGADRAFVNTLRARFASIEKLD